MSIVASSSALTRGTQALVSQSPTNGYVCARCLHSTRFHLSDGERPRFTPNRRGQSTPRQARAAQAMESLKDLARTTDRESQQQSRPSARPHAERLPADRHTRGGDLRGPGSQSRNPFNAPRTRAVDFVQPTAGNLLQSGLGTATIAGSDFQGVVRDRLKMAMQPGIETSTFKHASPIRPAALGQFTEEQGYIAARQVPSAQAKENYAQYLGEQYVTGDYGGDRVLHHEPGAKVAQMDVIEKATTMNSTFLRQDGTRFMEKVQSLMPVKTQAKANPTQRA